MEIALSPHAISLSQYPQINQGQQQQHGAAPVQAAAKAAAAPALPAVRFTGDLFFPCLPSEDGPALRARFGKCPDLTAARGAGCGVIAIVIQQMSIVLTRSFKVRVVIHGVGRSLVGARNRAKIHGGPQLLRALLNSLRRKLGFEPGSSNRSFW